MDFILLAYALPQESFLKIGEQMQMGRRKLELQSLRMLKRPCFFKPVGSTGRNKIVGPQVSPPILSLQPLAPMDFILLGFALPQESFLKIGEQVQMGRRKLELHSL